MVFLYAREPSPRAPQSGKHGIEARCPLLFAEKIGIDIMRDKNSWPDRWILRSVEEILIIPECRAYCFEQLLLLFLIALVFGKRVHEVIHMQCKRLDLDPVSCAVIPFHVRIHPRLFGIAAKHAIRA